MQNLLETGRSEWIYEENIHNNNAYSHRRIPESKRVFCKARGNGIGGNGKIFSISISELTDDSFEDLYNK